VFEATLQAIGERLRVHAGLRAPAWVLGARVRGRLLALGVEPDEYLSRLDGRELDTLVEALRVGETRFFRHRAHVAALRRAVVPALASAPARARRVRAWSAGCASGEEAYTLAMILTEGLPGWDVDVLGTDISDEALAVARAAIYPDSALGPVPAASRARWFRPAGVGHVAIAPELAARVRFERRNLVEAFAGEKDVILCRNVLIYFDGEARAETARRLVEALAPGGFLFLGYAESLRAEPGIETLRSDDGVVYRKPVPDSRGPAPLAATAPPMPALPPTTAGPVAELAPTHLRVVGSHDGPDRIAAELSAAIATAGSRLVVDLDGVDFLGDSVAPVFRRAQAAATAAGLHFSLVAGRPGPRRWLERHGLLGLLLARPT
jgi:chemotaxis methyl-accepting protein methylase/anti-anti-sigma regulatory factor